MSKSKHIRPKGIFRTFFKYLDVKGESHLEEIFSKRINGRPQNENTLTSIFKEMGLSEEQSKQLLREVKTTDFRNWKQKQSVSPSHKFYKSKGTRPIFNTKPLLGGSPGLGKGKSWKKQVQPIQLPCRGVTLSGALIPGTVLPKFTLHYQSNNLTYEGHGVSKGQEALYKLAFCMNDSGISFSRISAWLNCAGIKTHRGKTWSETGTHAHSVFKRMREREERIAQVRNARFRTSISNLSISCL